MPSSSPVTVLVSLPCDRCHAAPCGEDDIVCVSCRGQIRTARARVAADRANRSDVTALVTPSPAAHETARLHAVLAEEAMRTFNPSYAVRFAKMAKHHAAKAVA